MTGSPGEPWFDTARFEHARVASGTSFGARLDALYETESTNDLALASEKHAAPEGATFVARSQTAGRGRRGNRWLAAPGQNLTFSLLLRPEREVSQCAALPLVVGLALRQVVEERIRAAAGFLREPVLVKWPNDVLVGKRKIAGILVESRLRASTVTAAVVGVGLNVLAEELPEEIAGRATSLVRAVRAAAPQHTAASLAEKELAFEELLAAFLAAFEPRYRQFLSLGLAPFLAELSGCDALRDRRVSIEGLVGVGAGISEAGALRLIDDAGHEHHVSAGHVELV